jgi:hypothetical protein
MSSCQIVREHLLSFDWSAEDRKRAKTVLSHLESCPECAAAVEDFDHVRTALSSAPAEIPPDQWHEVETRLHAAAIRSNQRWRWIVAVAAAILVGALGVVVAPFISKRDVAGPPLAGSGVVAAFPPGEEARQVEAFNQISVVFDRRATWVMSADGETDLGLANQKIDAQPQVLLIRLTVQRAGQVASSADLVIVPGQAAKMTVPLTPAGSDVAYEIGTSAENPAMLSIWAQFKSQHGDPLLGTLATSMQMESGQTLTAGDIATPVGRYQLKVAFSQCNRSGRM